MADHIPVSNLGDTGYSEVHHPFFKWDWGAERLSLLVLDTEIYNAWYYIALHIFKKQRTAIVNFNYSYECSELFLLRLYCLQLGIQKRRNIELKTSCEKIVLCHLCNNTQIETLPCHSTASGIQFAFPSTSCPTHFMTLSTTTNEVLQAISLYTAMS